jgi:hypothetical protein
MTATRLRRRPRPESPYPLEACEQRCLLSAPYDFAAVGLRYDAEGGPSVYLAEGVVGADDSMTGGARFATLNGASDAPLDWASLTRGPRGDMTLGTRDGFTPYATQNGTQFIRDERWNVGSFAGYDEGGLIRDLAFLGQVFEATDFSTSARGNWTMRFAHLTPGGIDYVALEIFHDFNLPEPHPFQFTYHFSSGDVTDTKLLVSYENGRAVFDSGEVLILLADQSNMILADLDTADGIIGVASGISTDALGSSGASGWLRGEVGVRGPRSAMFFGVPTQHLNADGIGVSDVVIQIDYNDFPGNNTFANPYTIFDAADWDAGVRTPRASGTARFYFQQSPIGPHGAYVELVSSNGDTVTMYGGTSTGLLAATLHGSDNTTELLWGQLSRAQRRPELDAELLAHTDDNGRPIAYWTLWPLETPGDTATYSFDLILEAGGEPVVGELVTWSNLGNAYGPRTFVAGVSATGDVQVWQQYGDSWSYVNLTQSLPGARPVTPELFSTIYTTSDYVNGEQFLAAYDTEGMLVVYHQRITPGYPLFEWGFVDAERNGLDGHGSIPAGIDSFSGWTASWRAGHFAGIDDNGELWSVWWAPGMQTWRVDSLTDAATLPTLVGEAAAALTPWNTFHISAQDEQGHLIMTWWARENDEWRGQDLTTDFSGPIFQTGTLVSNFSQWPGVLNVGGLDDDGEFRVYWWSAGGWQIDSLTDGIDPADVPMSPRRLTSAVWGITSGSPGSTSQSLFGSNANGDLVRLIWRNDTGEGWFVQNVAEESVAYLA